MIVKKSLGIGVISLGWMGRLHGRSYRSIPERFPELGLTPRLVAAADPVEDIRTAAVDNLGFERAYADYRELLADPEVEAVSICSPNYLHHEMALAAVEAGKPFWIEKPMGISAAESRDIAQAAQAADLVTAVGFNYRHTPAIEYMRKLVRSGELGRITNVRVWFIADYNSSPLSLTLMIITMTAGTGLIMWLGELISERGIGNGMSLLIFTSIVARMPQDLLSIARGDGGAGKFLAVLATITVATVAVVFIEQATRRIPVQYAKRMIGRRQYGGSTTYIPIKINTAGVIPVIFASSILSMPQLVSQFGSPTAGWVQWIANNLAQTDPVYLVGYGLLILFFTFFYTAITFNPEEIADNMKKYGGFIPGIRAGAPTVRYLSYVINRVTSVGAVYLLVLALVPTLVVIWLGLTQALPFGGTTILIMVGVGLQTVKEINSQLQQRHYEGFLS